MKEAALKAGSSGAEKIFIDGFDGLLSG